ncbi:hypothetical protein RJ639_016461 [Escallonia herrerae]|uniref:CCHC-type domain-containing protein n=1 Tax=Escallonia herrerae TaxID=1293975 RepID=A0AA88VDN9_9ASTE|nr:hypothetical protein RJ639_016461 [Escallonia herrerae]
MASDGADSSLNPHVALTQRIDTLEGSVHEVSQTLAELRREVAAMNVRQDGNPRRNQEAPHAYARGGLHYDEQPRRNQHRQPPVEHGPERDDSDVEREERPLRQQRRDPGEYDYKQRAKDVPSFYGSMNVKDFLDWSAELDNFFEFHEIPMEKRVILVAYKFKGGAQAWWKNLQNNRGRQGKLPIRDWNRMKRELQSRFLPPDHEQILFGLYQNCKQGFRSVEEYTMEFHRLSSRNNLSETEPQQVMRYVSGLRSAIQEKLSLLPIYTLDEAYNVAIKAENQLTRLPAYSRGNNSIAASPRNKPLTETSSNNQPVTKNQPVVKSQLATRFPQTNQPITNPTATRNNPYARPFTGKCYKCGEQGHRSDLCRAAMDRGKVNLATREVELEGMTEDEKADEVCYAVGNEEESEEIEPLFVVRRLMLAPKT